MKAVFGNRKPTTTLKPKDKPGGGNAHKLPTNVCPQGDNNAIFCYGYHIQYQPHGSADKGNTRNWTPVKGFCSTNVEGVPVITGCGNAAASGEDTGGETGSSSKAPSGADPSDILNLGKAIEEAAAEGERLGEAAQAAEEEAGPLEGAKNYEVHDREGNPITDIDPIKGNVLWEQKSVEGATGTQTIESWVNKNVYTKFFRYLAARDELPEFYRNSSIGFDFTGQKVDPALRSAVESQIGYLRNLNLGVNINLEFSG